MATGTYCSVLQESIPYCEGTPVVPGVRRRAFYIAKADIASFPELKGGSDGLRPSAPFYMGNITPVAGKYFHYIDILPDKSQLTSESQGEYPNITQLNKFTGVLPNVDENAAMLANYVNNVDCIFLIPDMAGRMRVIGNMLYNTTAKVSMDLGQGPTGNASTTLEVEATDILPLPFYAGDIPMGAEKTDVIVTAKTDSVRDAMVSQFSSIFEGYNYRDGAAAANS